MVYVDNMQAPVGRYILCHMIADTEAELHAMAAAIGMPRERYQGDHYDICQARRARAVALGAAEITMRQAGAMHTRRKHTGALGAPSDAVQWLRAWVKARGTGAIHRQIGHAGQTEPVRFACLAGSSPETMG